MDPPPCVQNAMMTKDKKPFTYTPGGIDLSEVRSPRMQRRIERNANLGGVEQTPRPPPPQNVGPLPPSALAAMQPQIQVQVFPSGAPPPMPGGAPPPPPPPSGPPPPPPPPSQPLPMQKCFTSDNQVVERPDMTKIIPENPMALLRKSPGPQRKSFIEEVDNYAPQPQQTSFMQKPQSPPAQNNRRSFVDEVDNFAAQQQPIRSPPVQTRPAVQNNVPNRRSFVEEVDTYAPPPQQQRPPPEQSRPWMQQPRSPPTPKPEQAAPPVKTSSVNVGSLYIPPVNNQQQQNVARQVASPPTPPERHTPTVQSPSTPTLNKAPRPWQKPPPQEELPPWAVREPRAPQENAQSPPTIEPPYRPQQVQSPPVQRNVQQPIQAQPPPGANVVWVTQPQVYVHPGPGRPQQNQQPAHPQQVRQPQQTQIPQSQGGGVRIIPIQIEAKPVQNNKFNPPTPATPNQR